MYICAYLIVRIHVYAAETALTAKARDGVLLPAASTDRIVDWPVEMHDRLPETNKGI